MKLVKISAFAAMCLLLVSPASAVEKPTFAANSDARYLALRNPVFSGESYAVKDLKIEREGATFVFTGTFFPFAPVNGKVTGAVFTGEGSIDLTPPTDTEFRQLAMLTHSVKLEDKFADMFLRFTDQTYQEIKAAGTPGNVSGPSDLIENGKKKFRDTLRYNIAGRLLQDVNSDSESGLFSVLFKGKQYGRLIFEVDPHGVPALGIIGLPLAPEEVVLASIDEDRQGIWCSYHRVNEYKTGKASSKEANSLYAIEHQNVQMTIEKNAHVDALAITRVTGVARQLTVVPFDLYPSLRISSVTDASGNSLNFVQEDKDHDPQYFVILAKPLAQGEKIEIITRYKGKDALISTGSNNYYMVGGARESWYPNSEIGHFEDYELTLRIPKGLNVVATGNPVSEKADGNYIVSEWVTTRPEVNAGFQLGRFKKIDSKLEKQGVLVESYANTDSPDFVEAIKHEAEGGDMSLDGPRGAPVALGLMSTTDLGKKALAEGQLAIDFYTWLYGPSPFKRIALTQQTASNYGQSWPGLIFLPITYFFDTGVRHQLGVDAIGYFRVVAPHEVAHQWWGDSVGFGSYRDQWMSEGFADQAASMYLLLVLKQQKNYLEFWKDEHDLIVLKNRNGNRPIDVGPVTMGYRLESFRAGPNVTRSLIYPKGAYIAHMIHMLMFTGPDGNEDFRKLMTDFAQTYAGKNASTEDFKAIVEKHMTPQMDLDHNHRMDWFFNEYVYGTQLPSYSFESSFTPPTNGKTTMSFKLTQSGVNSDFKMLVPIYLDLGNKVIRIGAVPIEGNKTVEQKVDLPLKELPKRAFINYHYDVLSLN